MAIPGLFFMKCFITIWNRFSWAIPLCQDFIRGGVEPILIDNNSTYQPCIDWLKTCPHEVIFREKNDGPWAFFMTELYQKYTDQYFMISDSDQDISNVPSDFVDVLMKGFQDTEGNVWKSGLSQEVVDLPDNPYANEIHQYENGFWTNMNKFGYYRVWMDLGIAIYDKSRRGPDPIHEPNWYCAVRAPRPYTSRHLDWYLTKETLRDEDIYYLGDKRLAHYGWLHNLTEKYK
jgi:hypothetical protein